LKKPSIEVYDDEEKKELVYLIGVDQ